MLSVSDVQEILAIPFLGVIPESKSVLVASNSGVPVSLVNTSDAGEAYLDVVDRFLGQERPHRFMDVPRRGLLSRLFGT
jgi:septum site-determining protein MinD